MLVREDSGAVAGTVVPGKRPSEWIPMLVAEGRLEKRLAIGLAAALVQNPEPATICEGARLAARLGERVLGGVLVRALTSHDTALLMQVDPAGSGESVEDTLLLHAPALADLDDPDVRRTLLERLRNAGLPSVELRILCEHGDAEDLRTWLPAVLMEDLGEEERDALERRIARGDDGAATIRDLASASTRNRV
jgi:hypothetical protein